MKLINLVGKKFGKLTVISRGPDTNRGQKAPRWYCQCDCGNPVLKLVEGADLRRRKDPTLTCGCGGEGIAGRKNKKHGYSKTGEYSSYLAINRRCYDPKCKSYMDYGGRGIKVCDRWHIKNTDGLKNFIEDMGKRPLNASIERLNVEGGYSPENCVWISKDKQACNTRKTVYLFFNERMYTLSDLARELEVTPGYLKFRLSKGESSEQVHSYINEKRKLGKMILRHRWCNGNRI